MKITLLGSGASAGVPVLSCSCQICKTNTPRTRPSLFFHDDAILIEASPDIRQQLIKNNISSIKKVVLSHAHSDHSSGIWELEVLHRYFGVVIDLYIRQVDLDHLVTFDWFLQKFNIKIIDSFMSVDNISFAEQIHGDTTSLTIRYNDVVYANDFSQITHDQILQNADVIFWDCASWVSSSSHFGFDQLALVLKYNPKKVILINLSHRLDWHSLEQKARYVSHLITPGYDGMQIII